MADGPVPHEVHRRPPPAARVAMSVRREANGARRAGRSSYPPWPVRPSTHAVAGRR